MQEGDERRARRTEAREPCLASVLNKTQSTYLCLVDHDALLAQHGVIDRVHDAIFDGYRLLRLVRHVDKELCGVVAFCVHG
jgi:hypothetical protein